MGVEAWIEVSLTVDGELAEAVADVLQRFVTGGVVIEAIEIKFNEQYEGQAFGPMRVCGYFPADSNVEEQRQRLEESLWYLGRIQPLPAPEFKMIRSADWKDAWKEKYHPLPVGKKLIIIPAWLETSDILRVPIKIDPGMAFGTGTHPTTQLCLEMLEENLLDLQTANQNERTPVDVIDIGCGSGILAIAALKLGARHALGVDTDFEAVASAQQNALLNDIADRFDVHQGSVTDVLLGKYSLVKAHLILANILAPVIIRLLGEGLPRLMLPSGRMILSGILEDQTAEVLSALEGQGLIVTDRRQVGDWVALCVRSVTDMF